MTKLTWMAPSEPDNHTSFSLRSRAPSVLGLGTAPSTQAALTQLVSDSQLLHETINVKKRRARYGYVTPTFLSTYSHHSNIPKIADDYQLEDIPPLPGPHRPIPHPLRCTHYVKNPRPNRRAPRSAPGPTTISADERLEAGEHARCSITQFGAL